MKVYLGRFIVKPKGVVVKKCEGKWITEGGGAATTTQKTGDLFECATQHYKNKTELKRLHNNQKSEAIFIIRECVTKILSIQIAYYTLNVIQMKTEKSEQTNGPNVCFYPVHTTARTPTHRHAQRIWTASTHPRSDWSVRWSTSKKKSRQFLLYSNFGFGVWVWWRFELYVVSNS